MSSTRCFLVAFGVLWLSSAPAQVALGPRVGMALSNMAFRLVEGPVLPDLDLSTEPRVGLSGGLAVDIPVSAHFSLTTELGYQQRGFIEQVPASYQIPGGALNTVLEYLESPVAGRFHIGRGKARPHFIAGATFGHLFSISQYFKVTQGKKGPTSTRKPGDLNLQRWNVGLCGGAGLTMVAGRNHVILEGRYDHGLSGLWNELLLTDTDGNKIARLNSYDRTLLFSVILVFPMGELLKAKETGSFPGLK